MKTLLPLILFLLFTRLAVAQSGQMGTTSVLFIGNSYTYVNDLPQLLSDLALSTNDTLLTGSNAPGGYTFKMHCSNSTTLSMIGQGGWDFVVLQEQSQLPSLPDSIVETESFPYASKLDSLITVANPCAETAFYMTWGRKNGDEENCASWPPVCTYTGMDSLLNKRYFEMAQANNAIVSPVGRAWHYCRENFPDYELYAPDGSHPSQAGSYLAACCFYTVILRKDPGLITYDFSLIPSMAADLRIVAQQVVYDSLYLWNVGSYDPNAQFTYSFETDSSVSFLNQSTNTHKFTWDFGDGSFSNDENPVHIYSQAGDYLVQLTAGECLYADTCQQSIVIGTTQLQGAGKKSISVFPNPVNTILTVKSTGKGDNIFEYRVFDPGMRLLANGKISSISESINMSWLPAGIYILELIDSSNHSYFSTIVKM